MCDVHLCYDTDIISLGRGTGFVYMHDRTGVSGLLKQVREYKDSVFALLLRLGVQFVNAST